MSSNLLVVVDNHLVQTPDGNVWSKGIYDYSFFARYLSAFDEVHIAIRIEQTDASHAGFTNLCSGPNVHFLPLPEFRGIKGYVKNFFPFNRLVRTYSRQCDCAVIRLPSAVGFPFVRQFDGKKPYALEVVIDPWDYAAPGMLKMKFRPLVRLDWTYKLKTYCKRANGVAYVTRYALQKRYPAGAQTDKTRFESYYSSANIPESFYMKPKKYEKKEMFLLLHVANSISSYVKGHREAIEVVQNLNSQGMNVTICFVGDGPYIEEFLAYAKERNVEDKVKFVGRVSDKEEMKAWMRKVDLCILPTHGEGLPRVLIESMAVGTPCVATNVNGIPELLPEDQMAKVGDVEALTQITRRLLSDSDLLTRKSAEAVAKAREYAEDVLQERRSVFYGRLRDEVDRRSVGKGV